MKRTTLASLLISSFFFLTACGDGSITTGTPFQSNTTTGGDASTVVPVVINAPGSGENSYDFGSGFVTGTGADVTFSITNSTDSDISLIDFTFTDAAFSFAGGSFPGTGGTCSTTLPAGETCTVVINFTPTTTGTTTGDLVITYITGGETETVTLHLSGTADTSPTPTPAPAVLTISGSASYNHNFGEGFVGVSESMTFTIANTGASSALFVSDTASSNLAFIFKNGFPGNGGTCPASGTLASGSTCTVVVNFDPTAVSSSYSENIQITYNDSQTTQVLTINLQGTSSSCDASISGAFGAGSGTAGDPYQICSTSQLGLMTNTSYMAQNIRLMRSLDMSGVSFTPIGASIAFSGTFDGNGKTISNITVSGTQNVGFFAKLNNATVYSLYLTNVNISGSSNSVGGLAGDQQFGSISDVHVTGTIQGSQSNVGGLIGSSKSGGSIFSSSFSGEVIASASSAGGLIGYRNAVGNIKKSYSAGSVHVPAGSIGGGTYFGGLIGYSAGAQIWDSYSQASVTATSHVGGLIGHLNDNFVANAYSTGAVSGSSFTGGFLGSIGSSGSGLVSFWDTQTSGQNASAGGSGISGKTTAQMQNAATYPSPQGDGTGWDFSTVWELPASSYPQLQWQ